MQTSGFSNDTPMMLTPVAVAVVVGVILFGWPAAALQALNELAREIAQQGLRLIHGLLQSKKV